MTLQDKIHHLIQTDDYYRACYDHDVEELYSQSTETEKLRIDRLFIKLFGYSLETIIKEDGLR